MKEMVLVPKAFMDALNHNANPTANKLQALDVEMRNVLDAQLAPEQKLQKYNLLLEKYQALSQKQVVTASPEQLINNKHSKHKAKLLLKILKEQTPVTWSDYGEISIGGKPIVGSNISDVLYEVTKPKFLKPAVVVGVPEVLSELKKANTPQTILPKQRTHTEPPTKKSTKIDTTPIAARLRSRGKQRDVVWIES
jgi:hypothetical protein